MRPWRRACSPQIGRARARRKRDRPLGSLHQPAVDDGQSQRRL